MYKYRKWSVFILASILIPTSLSWAEISITNTVGLGFGKFATSSAGTVTIAPNGLRSTSGGVILVPSDFGTTAQFVVSGRSNQTFAISLPENDVVYLINGPNRMPVNSFRSSLHSEDTGTLSAGGTQTFFVGATLDVGSSQASGSYTGFFDVITNYN